MKSTSAMRIAATWLLLLWGAFSVDRAEAVTLPAPSADSDHLTDNSPPPRDAARVPPRGTRAAIPSGDTTSGETPPPALPVARPRVAGVRDVVFMGRLRHPRLNESSGLVASRQYPGVFWTHSDGGGGDKQLLHAVTGEGRSLGEYLITAVGIRDWEDVAIDDHGRLYLGDIGNNNARRNQLDVYSVAEPDPRSSGVIPVRQHWQLRFPARPFDCEALFVWHTNGYVVSKVFDDQPAGLYRFPLVAQSTPVILEDLGRLRVTSPVTGADISADGALLGLVAKAGAYVFRIDGDPGRAKGQKPFRTKYKDQQIEGCCFVPEGLLATAESREIYLFLNPAYRCGVR